MTTKVVATNSRNVVRSIIGSFSCGAKYAGPYSQLHRQDAGETGFFPVDPKAANRHVLDRRDRALIAALRRNARASLVALAREIDLSRSATHDRISRLEELKILRGYTVRVDEELIDDIRAFITVTLDDDSDQKAVAVQVSQFSGVQRAFCLAGEIDLLVDCRCDTAQDLGRLRDRIGALEGVRSCGTRLVLATHD
ncbi:Lrp/AsnC family transcriptional regulator [Erythrobacter aureus]|nr:Lrp/AsnC family transcriptional regulator [Erythrobacter aureus]